MPMSSAMAFGASRNLVESASHRRARPTELLAQLTIISLMCVSVLAPFVPFGPAFPAIRLEVVLLPLILAIYGFLLLTGYVHGFHYHGMFLVGVVYAICISISTWYGASFLGQALTLQDFYEFPKLFLPVVFFILAYEANLSELGLRRLLMGLAVAVGLVCIYAWAQWLNLGFSQQLNAFYRAGTNVDEALSYAQRVYSTMGNPNVLGQLLTWSVAAFLLAFLLGIGNRQIVAIVMLACLVTLGMTGSRYGLVDGALALFLVLFMPFTPKRRLSQALLPLVLLPLCVLVIGVVAVSNPRTLERFQTLNDPLHTDSAIERFESRWADALDNISESPILGRGPAKSIFAGVVVDSEYLGVLEQFGVLGLLAYLAYYLFPLFLIWRGMRTGRWADPALEARLPANYLAMRLSFVMIVTALVMNIGMSSFYNQLLQGFLWIWMGLGARAARTIGDASLVRSFMVRAGH